MPLLGSEVRVEHGAKYPELTVDSLFDRIINLKFIRWDMSSFVVRSDYEAVIQKDGSIQFVVCRPKPHIKVSYKQVSQSTAISVDIEVANLFIDKSQGDHLIVQDAVYTDPTDPSKGNPVTNIIVQMGYRGQFPDWTERAHNQHPALYYELYNSYIPRGSEMKSGMQVVVTVLDAYTDGNPPDQMTHFHGIIGTVETGLLWTHTEEDLIKTAEDFYPEQGKAPYLWQELRQWITRRFIRPDIPHRVITKLDKEGRIAGQSVFIYGLADYRKNLTPPRHEPWELDKLTEADKQTARLTSDGAVTDPAEPVPDTRWSELTLVDGILSEDDAALFGLPCRLSDRLLREGVPEKPAYGAVNEESNTILPRMVILSDNPQNSLDAQVNALCDVYRFLQYYVMPDGSLYFYHSGEQKEDLFRNVRIMGLDAANNGGVTNAVILPAVYDIEYSGTRTIRCPFYYLIAPMTVVFFSAKYYIGSLTGFYYYPEKKDAKYLTLQSSVEFDTDGDANTMTLMCVDLPEEEPPFIENGTAVWRLTEEDKAAIAPEAPVEKYAWEENKITIGEYERNAAGEKISVQSMGRWLDIIHYRLLMPLGYPVGSRWKALWADDAGKPRGWVYKRALESLREWNPELFTDSRLAVPSGENTEWAMLTEGAEGGPVLAVPILRPGDVVTYRYPWMPGYGGEGRR
jgi:hypothetical protein